MILKMIPEDFLVFEVPLVFKGSGKFCICELVKKNRNTEEAVQEVSKQLNISRKFISYAGTKDKVAITSQFISLICSVDKINSFSHDNISLKFLCMHDEPLSLGMLDGNKFKIVVRNLSGNERISQDRVINFFHAQRFSSNNVVVGKFLLKKDYKSAVNMLIDDFSWGSKIKTHLDKSKNDYVGALKTIPRKILTLYVHAFQSDLWNRAVKELLKLDALPNFVPIPGFSGFDADEITIKVLENIMLEEDISFNDFLNRDIPYLCIEGTSRRTISDVKNLVISDFINDELNSGMKKVVFEFELGKGEYATNVIEQLVLDIK